MKLFNLKLIRKMMEQMSSYRAEIESLKADLREERRARLNLNMPDSYPVSGAQSPIKSPMKTSQLESGKPTPTGASGTSAMKSSVREKFSFDEKAGGIHSKVDGRGTSLEKRSDSISISRKTSLAKQENNSNVMPHTPKDVKKPSNMPHGESEFKKMKHTPSLYVGKVMQLI